MPSIKRRLGVLSKEYTAKEQEKRLKIDLTRWIDDSPHQVDR